MGVFWSTDPVSPPPLVVQNFKDALRADVSGDDDLQVTAHATQRAQSAASVQSPAQFNPARFLAALAIVAVLLAAGIVCNAKGWSDSSKTLFTLATTAFGVVTGLLTGKS
jgi:hypothetical protein